MKVPDLEDMIEKKVKVSAYCQYALEKLNKSIGEVVSHNYLHQIFLDAIREEDKPYTIIITENFCNLLIERYCAIRPIDKSTDDYLFLISIVKTILNQMQEDSYDVYTTATTAQRRRRRQLL